MTDINKVTIGTDPEFVMIDPKDNTKVSTDTMNWLTRRSRFGRDCGGVFEVRADYHHNIIYVVNSIQEILQWAYDSIYGIRGLEWRAGHYVDYTPIGGHIHIGKIELNRSEINNFVSHLGRILITNLSGKIDNTSQRNQRRNFGYGGINDARVDWRSPYECITIKKIEYRAPGSFLVSPEVTFLNLILAKIVSMLYFTDELLLQKNHGLGRILKLIKSEDIFRHEEDIPLGIEILEKYIKTGKRIDWNIDFKHNWGIGT